MSFKEFASALVEAWAHTMQWHYDESGHRADFVFTEEHKGRYKTTLKLGRLLPAIRKDKRCHERLQTLERLLQ